MITCWLANIWTRRKPKSTPTANCERCLRLAREVQRLREEVEGLRIVNKSERKVAIWYRDKFLALQKEREK